MAAGAWVLCRWVPGLPALSAAIKSMLSFGMSAYGNFATSYLSRNLDKILIGWRHGAQPLGHYERAYYLFVMPVNQLSYPLTNVAVASLSRVRNDRERFRAHYLESLSMLALIGMPASAVLTLTGRDLLVLLLGPQWQMAGEIFTVFGPCIGVTLVYGTHGWLHLSLGRADRWLRWGIVELLVTVACFAAGLPFGAIGVAAAYTLSFYLLTGPGLWYAGRPAGFTLRELLSPLWSHALSAAAAGAVSGYLLYFVEWTAGLYGASNAVVRILAASVLCLGLHVLILVCLFDGKKSMANFLRFAREVLGHMVPGKSGG
jgi:PST family polysaccharide transporter